MHFKQNRSSQTIPIRLFIITSSTFYLRTSISIAIAFPLASIG